MWRCITVSTPQTMQPGLGPSCCGTHTTWRAVTRTYRSLLHWLRILRYLAIGDLPSPGVFCYLFLLSFNYRMRRAKASLECHYQLCVPLHTNSSGAPTPTPPNSVGRLPFCFHLSYSALNLFLLFLFPIRSSTKPPPPTSSSPLVKGVEPSSHLP